MIRSRRLVLGLFVTIAHACGNEPPAAAQADPQPLTAASGGGRRAFEQALPGSNGRSCATCHVLLQDTTLKPADVSARLRDNPADPLFNRIDADDPTAAELTFAHLEKGLVRVVLPLPDNMDVVDGQGHVVTPPDRRIFVWRGVPTVANTALTAPYQFDGRAASLHEQAQAAITSHSEGGTAPRAELDRIAAFERATFSSLRARFVGELVARGVPLASIPVPEKVMALSPAERRGRTLYDAACEPCHGGPTTDRIVNRKVHDFALLALKPDGNVRFEAVPGGPPQPVRVARPNVEIINFGYNLETYFGQIGLNPGAFNASVAMPRYRYRFYTDKTRSQIVVDLPPVPVTASGDPRDPRPARDASGAPIVGPNLVPQLFSTDPGRAAITGDPADFEAFDVPQLRGAARTAPYFHDNSVATLRGVLDTYSRNVLPAFPMLNLPAQFPPERPNGSKESLTPAQKDDLLAYLERL